MQTIGHRLITTQALSEYFSLLALEDVISANLGQDHWLRGQIGHPEYHFDQNAFPAGKAYVERNRLILCQSLQAGQVLPARQALGRLTHAAQDFYAHSNYIPRWLERFPLDHWPPPDEVDPFDESLLEGPDLRSGKIYLPLEPFSWLPGVGRLVLPLLPRDSHAWMNLDSPARGPAFAYAFAAAVKRTRAEYVLTTDGMSPEQTALLSGHK
jgi:hypothetical protein